MGPKVSKTLTLEMIEKCNYDDLVNQTSYSVNSKMITIPFTKLKAALKPLGFPNSAIGELMDVMYSDSAYTQHFNYRSDLDVENVVLLIGKAQNSRTNRGYLDLVFAICDATAFLKKQYMYVVETTTKKGKVIKQEVVNKIPRPLTGKESYKIQCGLKQISEQKAYGELE